MLAIHHQDSTTPAYPNSQDPQSQNLWNIQHTSSSSNNVLKLIRPGYKTPIKTQVMSKSVSINWIDTMRKRCIHPEQFKRVITTLQKLLECRLRTTTNILINWLQGLERTRKLARLDNADEDSA